MTKSNCIGHIEVQICLGDQNPLLPKSVPFCCCPATWLHHPASPQPPPLLSCPSWKKSLTWYNSGKTLSVLEMSSEKGSRVVPSGQLQPLPEGAASPSSRRKVMSMAPHCCWDTGYALFPHTLPQPPALAYSRKALVTWHSWEPPTASPYHAGGQPRQGTEGSAGCSCPAPKGGLCLCWLQDPCF